MCDNAGPATPNLPMPLKLHSAYIEARNTDSCVLNYELLYPEIFSLLKSFCIEYFAFRLLGAKSLGSNNSEIICIKYQYKLFDNHNIHALDGLKSVTSQEIKNLILVCSISTICWLSMEFSFIYCSYTLLMRSVQSANTKDHYVFLFICGW